MSEKRQLYENSEPGPTAKRRRANYGGAQAKHAPKPESSSWAKKRARDIERRMQRNPDSLPANVQQNLEREVVALQRQLVSRQEKKQRAHMISKYHMIRFFERKKAIRLEKQLRRRLDETEDAAEQAAIEADLHIAQMDRMYAIYFPFMEPYVSLYAAEKGEEGEEDDDGSAKAKKGKKGEKSKKGKEDKKSMADGEADKESQASQASKAARLLHAPRPPMWAFIETTLRDGGEAALKAIQERTPKEEAKEGKEAEEGKSSKSGKSGKDSKKAKERSRGKADGKADGKASAKGKERAVAPDDDSDDGDFFEAI